jgi:hypothetical protein
MGKQEELLLIHNGTLHTLKNFKDKLHDANPTVLWSGGGYHLLQPLHVILEMESIFAKFHEPSRGLMRYAEKLMTYGKAYSNYSNNLSFGNCMVRIPGSYNAKNIQFDDNGQIVNIPPKSEFKIVQPWNGYKPNIRWFLHDYWMHLIREKNNEVLNGLRKDQKRLRSQCRRGIDPTQCQQSCQQVNKIDWIESLYRKPLNDFRKFCIWRIFAPYFINIRRLHQSEALDLIKDWLDRCSHLKRLNFNAERNVKYALKTIRNFRPIGQDQLRMEND